MHVINQILSLLQQLRSLFAIKNNLPYRLKDVFFTKIWSSVALLYRQREWMSFEGIHRSPADGDRLWISAESPCKSQWLQRCSYFLGRSKMFKNFPLVISRDSSSPSWYARFWSPRTFSIKLAVVRLPNSFSISMSSISSLAIHLGGELVMGLLKDAANSATPGICSGHKSGEARSSFSKLSNDSSKSAPALGDAIFPAWSRDPRLTSVNITAASLRLPVTKIIPHSPQ